MGLMKAWNRKGEQSDRHWRTFNRGGGGLEEREGVGEFEGYRWWLGLVGDSIFLGGGGFIFN